MHQPSGWDGQPSGDLEAIANWGLQPRDARATHIITRGNVDGIISSALLLSRHPESRVTYVPSATSAVEILRKDLSTRRFYLADIGLTPKLIKTLNLKSKTTQAVTLLDHHQQSLLYSGELGPHVESVVCEAGSAATVALDHLRLTDPKLARLAAVADIVEYGTSPHLVDAMAAYGPERLEEEAQHLDFAWRLEVEDDRFRAMTSRRLARGLWPSEIPEVRRRYLQMVNENRWMKARERVRSRMVVKDGVALLNFGKRKPSLLGFGTRALTSVAREAGASVAVLVNRRRDLASIALRAVGDTRLNLGLFVEAFTREHGIVGGGHPTSAGAKINARHLPAFLDEIFACA
jgi:hypothetical protein